MDLIKKTEILNRYLTQEIHKVEGWCIPQLWQAIWPLYTLIGPGSIAEIGVYEGKFFIGLAKTFGVEFEHAAIDVFDMQEFNLDKAGVGKKDVFLENASRLGVNKIECIRTDSLNLDFQNAVYLCDKYKKFKFFSIDGCHDVLHTTKDIEFAMQVTADEGIIAVDDYINPDWPEVQEAVTKMYHNNEYKFIPLLFICGKLLLCSAAYHEKYLKVVFDYIKENHPTTRIKKVKRFGFDTYTIHQKKTTNFVLEWADLV